MIPKNILEMKVLVQDDMESIREALVSTLQGLGFTKIHQAINGRAGFEKIKEGLTDQPFQLIFSDVNMPHCTGIEFLKLLRAVDRSTPVIMITSESEVGTILDAVRAGASSYILKPFAPELMEQKILEVFAKRAANQK